MTLLLYMGTVFERYYMSGYKKVFVVQDADFDFTIAHHCDLKNLPRSHQSTLGFARGRSIILRFPRYNYFAAWYWWNIIDWVVKPKQGQIRIYTSYLDKHSQKKSLPLQGADYFIQELCEEDPITVKATCDHIYRRIGTFCYRLSQAEHLKNVQDKDWKSSDSQPRNEICTTIVEVKAISSSDICVDRPQKNAKSRRVSKNPTSGIWGDPIKSLLL